MRADYIRIPGEVLRSRVLCSTAKLLLGIIATESQNSEECNLSIQELADELGIGFRNCSRCLRELKAHGLIQTERRPPGEPAIRKAREA